MAGRCLDLQKLCAGKAKTQMKPPRRRRNLKRFGQKPTSRLQLGVSVSRSREADGCYLRGETSYSFGCTHTTGRFNGAGEPKQLKKSSFVRNQTRQARRAVLQQ